MTTEHIDVDLIPEGMPAGCRERDDEYGVLHKPAGDMLDIIPRSEWYEQKVEESVLVNLSKVKDQYSEGTCTSQQGSQGVELVRTMSVGKGQRVSFSAMSLYGTARNRGCGSSPNSGSTVSCIAARARDVGCLPEDTEANRAWMREHGLPESHCIPNTGWSQPRWPNGWEETAAKFRIDETFDVYDFNQFATCLLLGFPVGYGRDGHSILGARLVRVNGGWGVEYINSWGQNWNGNGRAVDSESRVSRGIRPYGAIAYRAMALTELDTVA